ncbi:hypothetical protein T439DRAFT_192954 [Meredithblackwellia eburnea MCA 4105]
MSRSRDPSNPPSPSLARTTISDLPLEIVHLIVSFAIQDAPRYRRPRELMCYALAGLRTLTTAAQSEAFREVSFVSAKQGRAFRELVEGQERLSGWVRKIKVSRDEEEESDKVATALGDLGRVCPSVNELVIVREHFDMRDWIHSKYTTDSFDEHIFFASLISIACSLQDAEIAFARGAHLIPYSNRRLLATPATDPLPLQRFSTFQKTRCSSNILARCTFPRSSAPPCTHNGHLSQHPLLDLLLAHPSLIDSFPGL